MAKLVQGGRDGGGGGGALLNYRDIAGHLYHSSMTAYR